MSAVRGCQGEEPGQESRGLSVAAFSELDRGELTVMTAEQSEDVNARDGCHGDPLGPDSPTVRVASGYLK